MALAALESECLLNTKIILRLFAVSQTPAGTSGSACDILDVIVCLDYYNKKAQCKAAAVEEGEREDVAMLALL